MIEYALHIFLLNITTHPCLYFPAQVLIDAQCSLDASVRHLLKYNKVGWLDFEAPSDDSIVHLQKRLIYNGFRLLAPGGYLIYSTCSFCKSQNERVVQWLLDNGTIHSIKFSISNFIFTYVSTQSQLQNWYQLILAQQQENQEICLPLHLPILFHSACDFTQNTAKHLECLLQR